VAACTTIRTAHHYFHYIETKCNMLTQGQILGLSVNGGDVPYEFELVALCDVLFQVASDFKLGRRCCQVGASFSGNHHLRGIILANESCTSTGK